MRRNQAKGITRVRRNSDPAAEVVYRHRRPRPPRGAARLSRNASIAWPLRPRRPGPRPPLPGSGRRRTGTGPVGALIGSSAASLVIASSRANRSSGGIRQTMLAWSRSTAQSTAAMLLARLRRAFSTRMRRIASAAAAKKWPRLSQPSSSATHQPQVSLVDQGRGLEGLAGLLLGQLLRGQLAELVVDQREELLGGLGSPCSIAERIRVTSVMARRSSRAIRSYHGHDRPRNAVAPARARTRPP